jgi:1-acyl-sn-glycerol-3-phosphate acyltransferase
MVPGWVSLVMATRTTSHSYPLLGGKASVRTRKDQLRGTFRGASLFGPRYLTLLRAARSADRQRMHEAERAWAKHAARAADLTIETHGMHRVDPTEQYVVAPLHEGFADVLALSRLPLDLAYSAADELFDWKLLGRYLTASHQCPVPVHNRAAAYRSIVRSAEASFCRGESYVMFPQGSILGIETAFHQGAFQLSARSGRPLLPVVLTGGASVWEYPYTTNLNFGQTIHLEVLEPVDASEVLHCTGEIESEMKERALTAIPGPRRFNPDRDGWWDDHPYEIDPAFAELADRVAEHRATKRAPHTADR